MSTKITGIVANRLVMPATPLPEGSRVEIRVESDSSAPQLAPPRMTLAELRKLSPGDRDAILAVAAALAEADYRDDKELTGFVAFSEEMDDDDYSDMT